MNINKLLAKLVEKGYTKNNLANALGISMSCLYNKLNGKTSFTQHEISIISKMLSLSQDEIIAIFFEDVVS